MQNVRASVVQAAPVAFDRERTLEKVRDLAADAARKGADLVVFPEAFVSAYPKGLDFGSRMGMRSPEGREDFRRYHDSAVEVLGDDALKALALELVDSVRKNATIDWTVKESVKANLRRLVRRALRRYGYPPDLQEEAVITVLRQAELMAEDEAA